MHLKSHDIAHPTTTLLLVLVIASRSSECSENGCAALCSNSDPLPDSLSADCPLLPSDCVVTNAPCYCNCAVCRGKLGEPCSETKPLCVDELVCVNPEGKAKEELYWWNFFQGGRCQMRKPDNLTEGPTSNDSRQIATYIFIIASIAVLLISLSYIGYLFFRQRPQLNADGSNGTMPPYESSAAELLLTFFSRFGKSTVRLAHPDQQTRPEQSEMQLLNSNLEHSVIQRAETAVLHDSLDSREGQISTPPPYSEDENGSHCLTIFLGVTLPEYTERQNISRPPSYNRIDEIL